MELRQKPATFFTFHGLSDSAEHFAIGLGSWREQAVPLVRVHSECVTGDIFGSGRCDCGGQLQEAVARFSRDGGILLYLRQEGRGIGLYNKLDAYVLQQQGYDTFAANNRLGFPADARCFAAAAQMLAALGKTSVRLLTNNPAKRSDLEDNGIEVAETLDTGVFETLHNKAYLAAKRASGHSIQLQEI
jgi:GTP cyclohydrolase II